MRRRVIGDRVQPHPGHGLAVELAFSRGRAEVSFRERRVVRGQIESNRPLAFEALQIDAKEALRRRVIGGWHTRWAGLRTRSVRATLVSVRATLAQRLRRQLLIRNLEDFRL